jgi:hypothetical protein
MDTEDFELTPEYVALTKPLPANMPVEVKCKELERRCKVSK